MKYLHAKNDKILMKESEGANKWKAIYMSMK
jgi:hypothetical protein